MITKAVAFSSLSITGLLVVLAFVTSTNYTHLALASVFYAVVAFLIYLVYSKPGTKHHVVVNNDTETVSAKRSTTASTSDKPAQTMVLDMERRAFLKFIGATSLSFFIFSLLGRRFESVIFEGKNQSASNNAPAEAASPTDKYKISDIDEQSDTTYYGFTATDGNWFIMKEESEGSFRYIKGNSGFDSNWARRMSLTYDYYYNVFK